MAFTVFFRGWVLSLNIFSMGDEVVNYELHIIQGSIVELDILWFSACFE